jgi:hypothetical protein
MRVMLATCAAALAAAAPAAALTVPKGVSFSTSSSVRQAAASGDKTRSCEARGQNRLKSVDKTRQLHPVACEQPPKSNLLSPSSVAKATAAALSVLG